MKELTYTRIGDYYIPNLKLAEQSDKPIGKYGHMRRRYLKEYRPALSSSLLLSEKLYPHLRADFTSAPNVSKPGQSFTFAI